MCKFGSDLLPGIVRKGKHFDLDCLTMDRKTEMIVRFADLNTVCRFSKEHRVAGDIGTRYFAQANKMPVQRRLKLPPLLLVFTIKEEHNKRLAAKLGYSDISAQLITAVWVDD